MEDRAMIERHLAQAEEHVTLGESHIVRQKQIVADMERDGHVEAAQIARELLETFESTQESHLGDRDRLRADLSACRL